MKKRNQKVFAMLLSAMTAMSLMIGSGAAVTMAETTEAAAEAAEETAEETAEAAEETAEAAEETAEAAEETTDEAAETTEDSDTAYEEAVRPEYKALDYVKLGEYTGLTIDVEEASVTDEEVEAGMNQKLTQDYYDEVTEGEVQSGDIANINYVGTMDGEEFSGGSADNYDLTIGSNTFIEGFEDGLIGVAIGSTVDLDLTFPENYYEDMAGKAVTFAVTVNSVKRAPEWSDELAEKISEGEYTDLESFRESVKEELLAAKEQERESAIHSSLLEQVSNSSEITSYPEELIQFGTIQYRNYAKMYAQMYGMSFADFIKSSMGIEVEDFDETVRSNVEEAFKEEMLLGAIAEQEGVELTDNEFQEKAAELGKNYGYDNAEDFISAYGEEEIRLVIRNNMVYDFLTDKAAK